VIAIVSGTSSLINAKLVGRLGMRRMITVTLAAQVAFTCAVLLTKSLGMWPGALAFPVHLIWTTSVFFVTGLTVGNLNALGLEPV
jgi:DHA1 family bicyclomycin/chloramphenicol resistance-like MFS transporter